MNYETKRDVLKDIVDTLHVMDGAPDDYCKKLLDRYDAALPDDLPVIPKEVGEYIKNLHKFHRGLVDVFGMVCDLGITRTEPNGVLLWVANNTNTFARAWVLGAWHTQETREVVKL